MKLDFVGIGTEKSGTTTIARLLEEHPQICLSEPKEVQFFNQKYSYRLSNTKNPNFLKSMKWYENHFAHCNTNSVKGEYSVNYFIGPNVPDRIQNLNPDIKLIVSFRNPANRAYSAYLYNKHFLKIDDTETFEKALDTHFEYKEMGLYFNHLYRFLAKFNRNQIYIIVFEDFITNQSKTMRELYAFLNVNDSFVPPSLGLRGNYSKKTRINWLMKFERFFVLRLSAIGLSGIIQFLKMLGLNKLTIKLYSKPLKYSPMNKETKLKLMDYFKDDTKKLSSYLGVDLFKKWNKL